MLSPLNFMSTYLQASPYVPYLPIRFLHNVVNPYNAQPKELTHPRLYDTLYTKPLPVSTNTSTCSICDLPISGPRMALPHPDGPNTPPPVPPKRFVHPKCWAEHQRNAQQQAVGKV